MLPFTLLLALSLFPLAFAAPQPQPQPPGSIHVPLLKRRPLQVEDIPHALAALKAKYHKAASSKRAGNTGVIPISDEQNDSSYSGQVTIGTPSQTFQVILDTGSSDLWVITTGCSSSGCAGIPAFDTSKSSTLQISSSSSLQIDYGSGSVVGDPAKDTVSFGGFTVPAQTWLAATSVVQNLLAPGVSGIMGLGFQTISSLQTPPVWQALYNAGLLTEPRFGVFLARVVSTSTVTTAPGGTLTLGGTNSSLYTGSIEYIDMPSGATPSYWLQQVSSVTIQGQTLQISSSEGLAAIDTGTTLIGAPSDIVSTLWSAVPGSQLAGSQYQGMYTFPCSTNVSVSISFGGTQWPINPVDMNVGALTPSSCLGAIFDIGSTVGAGSGVPSWIVGDTFLKNVYSVYQANPPAVGFAQLPGGLSPTSSGSGSGSSGGGVSAAVSVSGTRLSASLVVAATLFAKYALALVW